MGPCIINIFQYISNKMQLYTVYLHLETVLHVSVGTSTYHQERKQLYLQHLVFVTPLLLSAAIAAGSSNGTVTVLNTVGNCNTMVSIIILYYNLMELPSYMRSVFDRIVVLRRIPVSRFLKGRGFVDHTSDN
jgi:hypothetical protein